MKKNLVVCVCLFLLTVSVFGQAIDKAQYRAIDPFDYKLDEDRVRRGTERKFKSVVEFVLEGKEKGTTFYRFSSLDKSTLLDLEPRPGMKPPSRGQTVTVYFTANKRAAEDNRILDAFEDNRNKDEQGLGVEKSAILPSTQNLRKSEYKTITSDDYRDDALFTQEGDDDRKFKATLQFLSQEGIIFKFSSPENPLEQPAFLTMKVKRRYSQFTAGQRMVVYFTAEKEFKDFLKLDDIELVK
jgi:hypothetical protein